MSEHFICKTCGAQFAATECPPERCPICEEERQYIGPNGQQWTTLAAMQAGEYHNVIKPVAPGLTGIGTHPGFAIGQRALLIQTPAGNILWDCISLLDDPTIAAIKALGGIAAIAISHPHFYSSMVEWSRAFDAPVYLHADDRQWVMRPDASLVFWEGETQPLVAGVTAHPLRRALRRQRRPPLGGGRGRRGRAPHGRYHAGGLRPPLRQFHVQLPELDPAPRRCHPPYRRSGRAIPFRPPLRRLVGPYRRTRRQRRGAPLGGAIHRCDREPEDR